MKQFSTTGSEISQIFIITLDQIQVIVSGERLNITVSPWWKNT